MKKVGSKFTRTKENMFVSLEACGGVRAMVMAESMTPARLFCVGIQPRMAHVSRVGKESDARKLRKNLRNCGPPNSLAVSECAPSLTPKC
jgi:hypothetical protein